MVRLAPALIVLITCAIAPVIDASAREFRYKPLPPDDPVPEDKARRYYQGCKGLSPPRFTEQALETYCLCSASQTQKNLSRRDIYFLRNAVSSRMQKLALIKYIETVITPCLPVPVGMIFKKRCMEKQGRNTDGDHLHATCECVGERMREWTKLNAGAVISRRLERKPEDYRENPINALMEARTLLTKRSELLRQCIRENQN